MGVDLLRDELLRVHRVAQDAERSDLAAWAEERLAAGATLPAQRVPAPVEGDCRVCGERPARVRCHHCEESVCAEDAWTMLGLCRRCLTPEEYERARRQGRTRRPDLDVKWVDE